MLNKKWHKIRKRHVLNNWIGQGCSTRSLILISVIPLLEANTVIRTILVRYKILQFRKSYQDLRNSKIVTMLNRCCHFSDQPASYSCGPCG